MSQQLRDALNSELEKLSASDSEGHFVWPDDPQKSAEAARLMMGAEWTSSLDYWLDHGRDFFQPAQNESAPKSNAQTQRETEWREVLATLTPQQRDAAMGVMQNAMQGAFFSFLVALDQPPGMSLRLTAFDTKDDGEREVAQLLAPHDGTLNLYDLHDECHWWLETFSRHGETVKSDRLDNEMRRRLQMAAPEEVVEHTLSEADALREREFGRRTREMMAGMSAALANNPDDEAKARAEAMEHVLRLRDYVVNPDEKD